MGKVTVEILPVCTDPRGSVVEPLAPEVYRFTIPPGVSHAVRNTGTSPAVLVAFNTVAHDPAAPDTFRDLLLEG